jgi:hypothetical protein
VQLDVLTNAYAASDVPVVHAGYANYRIPLLQAGVNLYELKPIADPIGGRLRDLGSDSSRASLHAKTFVFDDEHVFIGSFNSTRARPCSTPKWGWSSIRPKSHARSLQSPRTPCGPNAATRHASSAKKPEKSSPNACNGTMSTRAMHASSTLNPKPRYSSAACCACCRRCRSRNFRGKVTFTCQDPGHAPRYPLSPSATRVMLLGAGELGKEVIIALQRLGVKVIAVDRYANAPGISWHIAHT